MERIAVSDPSQVAFARRAAAELAQNTPFNESATGRIAIVVTELANNLVRHANGGEIIVRLCGSDRTIIEILALDKGPGMADTQRCLRDGYSTAGTMGTGLGAVIRQSQSFDIFSIAGQGTAVLARLTHDGKEQDTASFFRCGCVNLAMAGEEECGDNWCFVPQGKTAAALLVVDGLGHGPLAASAANEAVRLFKTRPAPPQQALEAIHAGIRHTRGAALAVAFIDLEQHRVMYGGIGNIAGSVIVGQDVKRMVSHNGIAGLNAYRISELSYNLKGLPALVVLHSDGIGTGWALEKYPGLFGRDASLIAGVLYRDFHRERDDATVVVVKLTAT